MGTQNCLGGRAMHLRLAKRTPAGKAWFAGRMAPSKHCEWMFRQSEPDIHQLPARRLTGILVSPAAVHSVGNRSICSIVGVWPDNYGSVLRLLHLPLSTVPSTMTATATREQVVADSPPHFPLYV